MNGEKSENKGKKDSINHRNQADNNMTAHHDIIDIVHVNSTEEIGNQLGSMQILENHEMDDMNDLERAVEEIAKNIEVQDNKQKHNDEKLMNDGEHSAANENQMDSMHMTAIDGVVQPDSNDDAESELGRLVTLQAQIQDMKSDFLPYCR